MNSEESADEDFILLGGYSPHEAARLLERFTQSGIPFRTRRKTMGYDLTSAILVSIDPARAGEAAEIHRDLFGDALPNYDSSFFRAHRNI
ncbi:MAG: hypothetical protein H0X40_18530 [Chthoniobacterales bacterium]|nr:hypothetical protein [Chthoniobacterales bacterium]